MYDADSTVSPRPAQQPSKNGPVTTPDLHPNLEHIGWLVGTWGGLGVGGYPTIEGFRYEQELTFSHDGRPFLAYESRAWLVDDDGDRIKPSGRESGFWRATGERQLEVVLAHPTGIVEVYVGESTFTKIELATDVVARTSTAKEVTGLKRLYGKVEDDLAYAVDMAAVGQPLQSHLSARLQPVTGQILTGPP
ncbi:MAG: FABP family protein [Frankiaceae bacterium]|nr:FABP family protein [Frankiaceae bacterium]